MKSQQGHFEKIQYNVGPIEMYPSKMLQTLKYVTMNLRYLFLACFFIITHDNVISQELPKVVPPTPEAASLFKYLDYPVDYATGVPQINIPLYEARSGSISVPISINYHSSGRKVYDETGAIGLGWTLMAGGMISRTIYGDPDDNDYTIKFPAPWKKQADINPGSTAGADFLEGVVEESYPIQWYDTEYDFFSYSVNSISGKFIFRDDNNIKTPVLIPKKPYKVEYHKATIQSNINYFDYLTITDDKGTTYRFGKSLKDGTEYYETSSGVAKNSWLLTEILSSDKVDTIFLKYQSFSKSKRTVSQKTTVTDQYTDCFYSQVGPEYAADDDLGTDQDVNYTVQRIIEIKFRNGKVKFNLQSGGDVVQSIQIENSKNEIIRMIEFNHSTQDLLSDGNAPTKRLNSLIIKDGGNNSSEKYNFDYYPTVSEVVNGRSRDLWGYYNASGSLVMRPVIENIQCQRAILTEYITIGDPAAIRTPNEAATKSGVLKKITFPTGGSTEFFYELNRYNNANTVCGGLRLSQSITSDGQGNDLTKTYKYGVAESGYGTLGFIPDVSNMSYETRYQNYVVASQGCTSTCKEVHFRQRVYSADVLPIFSEFHQRPVFYQEVTEYHGTVTVNIGKSVYAYDMGNLLGAPTSVQGLFAGADVKHWKQSSLLEKRDYKNVGGSYQLVKKLTNGYQETVYSEEKVWGLHVGKYYFMTPYYIIDPVSGLYVPSYWDTGGRCESYNDNIFKFADYTISVGKKELTSTIETLYGDNGTEFTATASYAYNSNHLLNSTTKSGSNSETLVTEHKYPFDFTSESICITMVNRNMLNYIIEENNYKNSSTTSSVKTSYKDWGGSRIKPEIISTKQGTSPYEQRLVFLSYDEKGNMQCVSKDNGLKIGYLYGYKKELPVAEVKHAQNTKYSEILQSSSATGFSMGGITPVSTSKTFTVDFTGTVRLKVGMTGNPSYTTYADYSSTLGSGTITLTNGQSCGYNQVVFNNVAPGTYSMDILLRASVPGVGVGACGEIEYPDLVTATYGITEMFYESFEEGSFATGPSPAHTGKQYFIGDYNITAFTIPNSRSYIVEYWYLDGSSQWQYVNTGFTNGMTLSNGSAIDDVRIYPSDAFMTSYTHEPLVGVTSIIDANGRTVYYDYDTFGRLWRIRNDKGEIEKQLTYNYKTN